MREHVTYSRQSGPPGLGGRSGPMSQGVGCEGGGHVERRGGGDHSLPLAGPPAASPELPG